MRFRIEPSRGGYATTSSRGTGRSCSGPRSTRGGHQRDMLSTREGKRLDRADSGSIGVANRDCVLWRILSRKREWRTVSMGDVLATLGQDSVNRRIEVVVSRKLEFLRPNAEKVLCVSEHEWRSLTIGIDNNLLSTG